MEEKTMSPPLKDLEPVPIPVLQPVLGAVRSSACTLSKAVLLIKPSFQGAPRRNWLSQLFARYNIPAQEVLPDHWALGDFVLQHPAAVDDFQKKLGVQLVVVKATKLKMTSKHAQTKLVYDGRHCTAKPKGERAPGKFFYLGCDNQLILLTDNLEALPRLNFDPYRYVPFNEKKPLWQLLGYEPSSPSDKVDVSAWPCPQTWDALRDYVHRFKPSETQVTIQFATSPCKKAFVVDNWLKTAAAGTKRSVRILAYATSDYSLVYTQEWDPGLEQARRRGNKKTLDYERYRQQWKEVKAKEKAEGRSDARQANCAAAVHVTHTGLNQAYDLGLVSKEEMAQLSAQLGLTHSSVYVFLDQKHHLRHITYYDEIKTFSKEVTCFENDCSDLNEGMTARESNLDEARRTEAARTMLDFWRCVWDRRSFWIEERAALLRPLMERLEQLLAPVTALASEKEKKTRRQWNSPISRCLAELKKIIQHQRVYLFSAEDAHLHSIKFYLTHFAYQTLKSCRGVSIKAQSDDALVKLSIPGLTVWNLYTYFRCKQDQDFFATLYNPWVGPKPSEVIVSHTVKTLRSQRVMASHRGERKNINVLAYCYQHGWLFARHILRYWCEFAQFLLGTFGYEIHGQTTLPSASYLAFQCVWTLYVKKAGPLAQGLERTKPHYEDLLRQFSRGGFMFSTETALRQGEPLLPGDGGEAAATTPPLDDDHHKARSIAEYDLVSAYGYGAAQSYLPSGFCVGFKKPKSTSPTLERLDSRARHRSFEFRAVYKILHRLVHRQGVAVRSVYHNFSPLGIFTLGGKYNLDLAIVTEDGGWLLLNMDNRYSHSCDRCLPTCEENDRFIQGQTHEQLRAKTRQRDADINAWVSAINAGSVASGGPADRASYAVVNDCHTPGYSSGSLKYAFLEEPKLAELVHAYRVTTDQCGKTLHLSQFRQWMQKNATDKTFTFIALARVKISPSPDYALATQHWIEADCRKDGSFSVGPLVVYTDQNGEDPTQKNENAGLGKEEEDIDDDDDDDYFTDDRRSKKNGGRQRLAWQGTVVLTRDYYQFLEQTYGDRFLLEDLEWVLFYKTEPVINSVYQTLIDMRSTTQDPVLVTFIKRMVNLSAGFYGAHTSQLDSKTTYRLVNGLPKNYAFFRHSLSTEHSIDLEDASYHLLETKPWPRMGANRRQPSKSAVPLFLTIVEYGKLRLIEILEFLREHLWPGSFRLMYGNVDNLLVALSRGSDHLDEAVMPSRRESYQQSKPRFFISTAPEAATEAEREQTDTDPAPPTTTNVAKTPGLAETKWERYGPDSGWKFITLRTQHYCLSASDCEQNLHKTSGWSNVTSEQVFGWAEKILQGRRVAVPQKRRVHKMLSMETRDVLFHY